MSFHWIGLDMIAVGEVIAVMVVMVVLVVLAVLAVKANDGAMVLLVTARTKRKCEAEEEVVFIPPHCEDIN